MPPANDAFADAVALDPTSGSVDGTTFDATMEVGEPETYFSSTAYVTDQSVWYTLAPSASGLYEFTLTQTTQTLLDIFTGSDVTALTVVISAYAGTFNVALDAGTTYMVRVYSPQIIYYGDAFNARAGPFTLAWVYTPPPANDDIANAETISGATGTLDASTIASTYETTDPDGNYNEHSIWYVYVPTLNALDIFMDANYDAVLGVYRGTPGSLVEVGFNDDGNDHSSELFQLTVTPGETLYILTGGYSNRYGSFTLTWSNYTLVRPSYDDIANAFEFTVDGATYSHDFDTQYASLQTNEAQYTEGNDYPSVWAKVDVSSFAFPVAFEMAAERVSGTITPYVDSYATGSSGFDPATPDFSLLSYGGFYLGDRSATPPAKTGELDPSLNVVYFFIGDWYGNPPDGVIRITTTFFLPLPPLNPADDVSTGTTVTVLSDAVKDDFTAPTTDPPTASYGGMTNRPVTFSVRGSRLPVPGLYRVSASVRGHGFIGMSRSGLPMLQPIHMTTNDPAVATTIWLTSSGYAAGGSDGQNAGDDGEDWVDAPGTTNRAFNLPWVLPVAVGDEIGFHVSGGVEVLSVHFSLKGTSPLGSSGAPLQRSSIRPLGDASVYSSLSLGTQSDGVQSVDICCLSTDVYSAWTEHQSGYSVALRKWDGTAWSLVSNDIWGHGVNTSSREAGAVALATDGTHVFIAWSETDGTTTGGVPNWHWRCKQYTPSGGLTELGTGQRRFAPATVAAQVCSLSAADGIELKCSAGGVLWAAMAERDTSIGSGWTSAACVWKWTNGAWKARHPPIPKRIDAANVHVGVSSHFGRDVVLSFVPHIGPSENPSVLYPASDLSDDLTVGMEYMEFDGSGWGNEAWITKSATSAEADYGDNGTSGSAVAGIGMCDDGSYTYPTFVFSPETNLHVIDQIPRFFVEALFNVFVLNQLGLPANQIGEHTTTGTSGQGLWLNKIMYQLWDLPPGVDDVNGVMLAAAINTGTRDYWGPAARVGSPIDRAAGTVNRMAHNGTNLYVLANVIATDGKKYLTVWEFTQSAGAGAVIPVHFVVAVDHRE